MLVIRFKCVISIGMIYVSTQIKIGDKRPFNTLIPSSKVDPMHVEDNNECISTMIKLLDDYWGSLLLE
jgi:hypothetical protein